MIERHVALYIHPGSEQEFVEFFQREYLPALQQSPGFIQGELLQRLEDRQDFTMILRFSSQDAAALWRGSRVHETLKPRLKSLYSDSQLRIFDVIE